MSGERLKTFTAFISVISVILTFLVFTLESFPNINRGIFIAFAIGLSAYTALFSIFYTRRKTYEKAKQKRIFIIYAKEDLEQATQLSERLVLSGFRPWLDTNEIFPGQVWEKTLMNALENSVLALFLVSKNTSLMDGFFSKEVRAALATLNTSNEIESPVIPIRLDDSKVPEELAGIQWVDLTSSGGYEKLLEGLNRVLLKNDTL